MNSGQITSVIKLGLKEKNCGFVSYYLWLIVLHWLFLLNDKAPEQYLVV